MKTLSITFTLLAALLYQVELTTHAWKISRITGTSYFQVFSGGKSPMYMLKLRFRA